MIAVTAATGNIGTVVVEALLRAGHPVRAIARTPEKLARLGAQGAETQIANLEDPAAVAAALAGAQAVLTLIPPNVFAPDLRAYQRRVAQALAAGIAGHGIAHVVNISSVGAHLPTGTGPIGGLHESEQILNAIPGLNVLHLRPGFFMENFFHTIDIIKGHGIAGFSLRGDVPMTMTATRDIGAFAAARLAALDFSGISTHELLGERNLTPADATRVLGTAIGKPDLPYVQFSYTDAERAITGLGLSQNYAQLLNEMNAGFNDGHITPTETRSARNTTPTSIEAFASTFAAVYDSERP